MSEPLAIVVMAKYPTPGRVKTRLQPRLSPDESAEIQRIFIQHTVERLGYLGAGDLVVCFDPPEQAEAFAELIEDRAALLAQSDGDLGQRLANVLLALADEYERVLFLGVDSPDVPEQHLLDLIEQTLLHDATIAPTQDGGYWGLGIKSGIDLGPILASIEWSSGVEYQQTMDRLETHGIEVGVGKKWSDVDHVEDLVALYERLIASHDSDDRLLFAQIKDLCPVLTRDGSTR